MDPHSDFLLLQTTVKAASLVCRPGPPSLPQMHRLGWGQLSLALRYYAVLRLLLGLLPPSSRSRAYRPTCVGTQQISQGKILRFRDHPVANTPGAPTDTGLRRWRPTYPLLMPYGASLAFKTVTHLWLPPDLPSRERTSPIQKETYASPVSGERPLPRRCRVPSVRASG